MTNPDGPQVAAAEALAESGATNDEIQATTMGFYTEVAPDPSLPTLPVLPNGFDWRVVLKEHRDSTNQTDSGRHGDSYNYAGWFWEDGRPICGHRHAVVYLRQNGVVLKKRTVQVEGLDTEIDFVTAVVGAAEHLYTDHDGDRRDWLAADFTGLQEN